VTLLRARHRRRHAREGELITTLCGRYPSDDALDLGARRARSQHNVRHDALLSLKDGKMIVLRWPLSDELSMPRARRGRLRSDRTSPFRLQRADPGYRQRRIASPLARMKAAKVQGKPLVLSYLLPILRPPPEIQLAESRQAPLLPSWRAPHGPCQAARPIDRRQSWSRRCRLARRAPILRYLRVPHPGGAVHTLVTNRRYRSLAIVRRCRIIRLLRSSPPLPFRPSHPARRSGSLPTRYGSARFCAFLSRRTRCPIKR